ncbi:MAG: threonine/homoserine/homoserine lactone efflux protein [Saprospiraceae bacterium]|jgi:threonine/homoserine/homoserine lactone efflux protein
MSFQSAISLYVIIFLFALTPGPGIFALIARVMGDGFWVAVPLGLGVCLGDILYMLLVCFGLATFASNWGEAMLLVRYLGAAYRCYLGYKVWTGTTADQKIIADSQEISPWASFLQGALISVSNPKVILFYLAFLPTILQLETLHYPEMISLSVIIMLGEMTAILLFACGAFVIKGKLQTAEAQTMLNRFSGGMMVGAGSYLALRH